MIMTEYNRILMEVIALPDSFASSDVLDEKIGGLKYPAVQDPLW